MWHEKSAHEMWTAVSCGAGPSDTAEHLRVMVWLGVHPEGPLLIIAEGQEATWQGVLQQIAPSRAIY